MSTLHISQHHASRLVGVATAAVGVLSGVAWTMPTLDAGVSAELWRCFHLLLLFACVSGLQNVRHLLIAARNVAAAFDVRPLRVIGLVWLLACAGINPVFAADAVCPTAPSGGGKYYKPWIFLTDFKENTTFGENAQLEAMFDIPSLGGTDVTGQTVCFYRDNAFMGTAQVVHESGLFIADYTASTLPVGTYKLQACYPGNGADLTVSCAETTFNHVTSKATPNVLLDVEPEDGSKVGETVTLTVTFDQNSLHGQNVNGDTVDFYDGGARLNGVQITDGKAVYPTNSLTVGKHQLKAHYNGDANLNGVDSNTVTYPVN